MIFHIIFTSILYLFCIYFVPIYFLLFSMIDFATMLKAHLDELSQRVLDLAEKRRVAFKSFLPDGFNYASALTEFICDRRLMLIGEDIVRLEFLRYELCAGLTLKKAEFEDLARTCRNPDFIISVDSTELVLETTRQLWLKQDSKVLIRLGFYSDDAFRQAAQLIIHSVRTNIAELAAFGAW